ncbi:hypothetical protein PFLUV_G00182110 [Perca fluviatilis]|uniref:Uncharacterized protein n=1 Tax=Perca fluviatilis TaxID=8168 RepID=A0A6A5ENQ2_PERFL|nr:hypothetical protein PFLUV_G00182110 [Perca fluviatilis]
MKTHAIGWLRILVKMAIGRVKEYHIWNGLVPLSTVGLILYKAGVRVDTLPPRVLSRRGVRVPTRPSYFEEMGCRSSMDGSSVLGMC